MTIDILIPVLRQLLQILGGWLITQGYMDEGILDAFIGVFINGIAFVWWGYDRWRINRVNKVIAKVAADKTDTAGA